MDHFAGVTPQERFNNDLLNEIRKLNANMEKLSNEPKPAPKVTKRT